MMSYDERNTVAGLLVGLGFLAVYTLQVGLPAVQGAYGGAEGAMALAQRTLWLVGGAVVVTIAATILINILYGIATNDSDPDMTSDERGRQIEISGDRIGAFLCGIGVMAGVIAVARGMDPVLFLVWSIYAFAGGSLIGGLVQVARHRRGY